MRHTSLEKNPKDKQPGGGGGTQVLIGTHCQTAARSGSGERQNSGAVNSF